MSVDDGQKQSFWDLIFCSKSCIRALKISLFIGTILIAINQGDIIMAGGMPPIWKIILTYLVPFGVSSYSSAKLLSEMQKK